MKLCGGVEDKYQKHTQQRSAIDSVSHSTTPQTLSRLAPAVSSVDLLGIVNHPSITTHMGKIVPRRDHVTSFDQPTNNTQ
jgi:hypothetical protein